MAGGAGYNQPTNPVILLFGLRCSFLVNIGWETKDPDKTAGLQHVWTKARVDTGACGQKGKRLLFGLKTVGENMVISGTVGTADEVQKKRECIPKSLSKNYLFRFSKQTGANTTLYATTGAGGGVHEIFLFAVPTHRNFLVYLESAKKNGIYKTEIS